MFRKVTYVGFEIIGFNRLIIDPYVTAIWLDIVGDHFHGGRFSGAIWTQETQYLSGIHFK